ncbi:MAG: hypothetical protein ACRC14_02570, partial [Paracoccaceae bacterium]
RARRPVGISYTCGVLLHGSGRVGRMGDEIMSLIQRKRPAQGEIAAIMAESPHNRIACPLCKTGFLNKTVDSRPNVLHRGGPLTVRRVRKCDGCGERSATVEITEGYLEAMRSEMVRELMVRLLTEVTE